MTPVEAQKENLKSVINSNIDAKYFSDYAVVTAVYGTPVSTVDVTHFAPAYYDDGNNPVLSISKGVEVLYTATSGVSIEIPVAVGDTVLLVGSHSLVAQLSTVKNAPQKPGEDIAYTKETLKAIPVGVLDQSAGVYLRFKDGKVQLKNQTQSYATIMSDLIDAIVSIVTVGTAATQTLNPASQTALNAVKTRLLQIMEA